MILSPKMTAFDQLFARLLIDLEERGLLGRTLGVWLGEFGCVRGSRRRAVRRRMQV